MRRNPFAHFTILFSQVLYSNTDLTEQFLDFVIIFLHAIRRLLNPMTNNDCLEN